MTALDRIRLRYLTWKLRALCWVLRRLRAIDPASASEIIGGFDPPISKAGQRPRRTSSACSFKGIEAIILRARRREVDFLLNHPKNFTSSRAGQSQKPDALAKVAKRVCEACQTAKSSESDRTRSKHPFRAEAREYHLQEYQYSYCLATAALASSRTSLRDHGFEVNRTPPGRTMFETGLPDVTRTST
jgi:hypothetical protein